MSLGFQWIGQSLDGDTVLLRRFTGAFATASYATPEWLAANADKIKTGTVVDVETTGLNKKNDSIIEVGLRQFQFNRNTGELLRVGETYSGFQDPGRPLSDEIKRLTGITDKMVAGQQIDWARIDALLGETHLVIAHNAAFDRPFIEQKSKASATKAWACSLKQVDWARKGFSVHKLDILSIYHGFFTNAHRALHDAEALLHLLSMNDFATNRPYLNELLINARRAIMRVAAIGSPFETKDLLKERGYFWDAVERSWAKTVFKEDAPQERAWLESAVYKGEFKGRIDEIPLIDQFK